MIRETRTKAYQVVIGSRRVGPVCSFLDADAAKQRYVHWFKKVRVIRVKGGE